MASSHWTYLTLLAIAGCAVAQNPSSGAADENIATGTAVEPQSGTRLHALAWQRGSDLVATGAFKDTQRNELCAFWPTTAGLRCIPTGATSAPESYVWAIPLFLDATCQTAGVAWSGPTETQPRNAILSDTSNTSGTCGYGYQSVALGAAPTTQDAWTLQNGECKPYNIAQSGWKVASFTVNSPTDFVAGTEERVPVNADVAAGRLRGSDGSISPYGFYDLKRDTMCYPDGSGTCVPNLAAYIQPTYFADATCTGGPAAYFSKSWGSGSTSCGPKLARGQDACGAATFFDIGAATTAYSTSGTECKAVSGDPSLDYYRIGNAIPLSSLPSLPSSRVGGVLQTKSTTGQLLQTALVHDDGRVCQITRTADGADRCVVFDTWVYGNAFADAGCTTDVVEASPAPAPPAGCAITPAVAPRTAKHLQKDQYYALSTTTRNVAVYQLVNGVCKTYRSSDVYDVTPLPLTTFDAVTVVEEPTPPPPSSSSSSSSSSGATSTSSTSSSGGASSSSSSSGGAAHPDAGSASSSSSGGTPRPDAGSASSGSSGHPTSGDDDDDVPAPAGGGDGSSAKKPSEPHPKPVSGATIKAASGTSGAPANADDGGCATVPVGSHAPASGSVVLGAVALLALRRRRR